jgi:hypothetical protein
MCRSIKTLFNFEPPVTDDEIRAASLQFVRKVSGFTHPSKANEPAFQTAIDEIESASRKLLISLQTTRLQEPESRKPRRQRRAPSFDSRGKGARRTSRAPLKPRLQEAQPPPPLSCGARGGAGS